MKLKTLKSGLRTISSNLRTVSSDSWREGKTTAERGYGYRWQKERLRFLEKNPLCSYCETDGRVSIATVVDHKTPHRGDLGLFWERSNWQPLCKPCHDVVKKREESSAQ